MNRAKMKRLSMEKDRLQRKIEALKKRQHELDKDLHEESETPETKIGKVTIKSTNPMILKVFRKGGVFYNLMNTKQATCKICGKKFKNQLGLRSHMGRQHK